MKICTGCLLPNKEYIRRDRGGSSIADSICTDCISERISAGRLTDNGPSLDDEINLVRPTDEEFVDVCHAAEAMFMFRSRRKGTIGWNNGCVYRGVKADEILEKYTTDPYPGHRYIQLAGCAIALSRYWG